MHTLALLLSSALFSQSLTLIAPSRTYTILSKPMNLSEASNTHPLCFTTNNPPHAPPNYTPLQQDCAAIARAFNDKDTRRPPKISTFAKRGTVSPGEVDFELPISIIKGTCRAALAMRRGGPRIGRGFVFKVAEEIVGVQEFCAQEGRAGLGGGTWVGDGLDLVVYGVSPRAENMVVDFAITDSKESSTGGVVKLRPNITDRAATLR